LTLTPQCITGFPKSLRWWGIFNSNQFSLSYRMVLTQSGDSAPSPPVEITGEVQANSEIFFATDAYDDNEVWDLYALSESGTDIHIVSQTVSSDVCPVRAEGCCGSITLYNDAPFMIKVLIDVLDGESFEERIPYTLLPCTSDNTTACYFQISTFNSSPRTYLVSQMLPSGEMSVVTFDTTEDLSQNCDQCPGTTGTSGTSDIATTGTTGTSFQISTTGDYTSTGSTYVCPLGSVVTEPEDCKGGSQFDYILCICENCPLASLPQPCSEGIFNVSTCECIGSSNSTAGGSGGQPTTTYVTSGVLGAGTVAGALGAAAYFLANRKKQPEEQVEGIEDVFAHVVEQNPLYVDPLPTYENPIYSPNTD